MNTSKNREFVSNIISEFLLDEAIEWIASTLTPEEVFDEFALSDWAYENGFTKDEDDEE